MRRRDLIKIIAGSAAAWPLAAQAQQSAMPVVGFLSGASLGTMHEYVAEFKRGLADTGFTEGRNVVIEYRWAEGHNDHLPTLAADLVRRGVTVIVAFASTPAALAMQLKQSRSFSLLVLILSKLVLSKVLHGRAVTSQASQLLT
jgi:putative ABC transport system substrate-binding protein